MLSVDAGQRRISVARVPDDYDRGSLPTLEIGAKLSGRVQRVERYGVFVWLRPGAVGLMPTTLTGTPPGTDLRHRFPVGQEAEVEVRELADDGRRIRLAAPGAQERAESRGGNGRPATPRDRASRQPQRAPRRSPRPVAAQPSDDGFGTLLADKLRAALGPEPPQS